MCWHLNASTRVLKRIGSTDDAKGCPMFLKSNVVSSFVALHEGSIQGDKTQPVIELYPQDKQPWFGNVTGESILTKTLNLLLMSHDSWREEDDSFPVGPGCVVILLF